MSLLRSIYGTNFLDFLKVTMFLTELAWEKTILDEDRLAIRLPVVNDSSLANLFGEESKVDPKVHLWLVLTAWYSSGSLLRTQIPVIIRSFCSPWEVIDFINPRRVFAGTACWLIRFKTTSVSKNSYLQQYLLLFLVFLRWPVALFCLVVHTLLP